MRIQNRVFTLLISLLLLAANIAWAAKDARDIIIVHTNDSHCGVADNLGFAKIARLKKDLKKDAYVLLVDAGDAIQGAPLGTLSKGGSINRIMNAAGYDYCIPGNHEFDFGMERFLDLSQKLKCGYHSCNFTDLTRARPVFPAYEIFDMGGTKVALIGATTPATLISSTPAYFKDQEGNFIYGFCEDATGDKLCEAVQKAVDRARGEGADYCILVGHLGMDGSLPVWSSESVIKRTSGIDAVIDAHSHEEYVRQVKNKEGKDVLLEQAGYKLSAAGKITITPEGKISGELVKELQNSDRKTQKAIDKEIRRFKKILSRPAGETKVELTDRDAATGTRRVRRGETNLGDLVADSYRYAARAQIAMVNGGSLRSSVAKGTVTYDDLLKVLPFGNQVVAKEVTGRQILDALELGASRYPEESGGFLHVSGLRYTIDATVPSTVVRNEKGEFTGVGGERRIKDVFVGDEPLDLDGDYRVAGSDFTLKKGGDGMTMFKSGWLIEDLARLDIEAVLEYVKNELHGTIEKGYEDPRGSGRITIIE